MVAATVAAMPRLFVLRVFCDERGAGGNPLGVFLDGGQVPADSRQAVAADLGFSETVFVDDMASGELRIFTPAVELDFAGHPTVGSAWLLAHEGRPARSLRVPAGELAVRYEEDSSFVRGRPEWGPPFEHEQLGSADEVDALDGPPRGHDLLGAWAWIDEPAGTLRARVFPRRLGIEEDEATGSAAAILCERIGRAIEIRQGRSSRILARPVGDGRVEIGGRSFLDKVREYRLPG
jgi:predicted PhzF superfamily epimerase YddE/YHI9